MKLKPLLLVVISMILIALLPTAVLADGSERDASRPPEYPADLPWPLPGPPDGFPLDEPWPGADVATASAHPLAPGTGAADLADEEDPWRRGWTDGWYDWYFPADFHHIGSHTSNSDLVEDVIRISGFMRVEAEWDSSCVEESGGKTIHCQTHRMYYLPYDFWVESDHFFQKAGWIDTFLETGKLVEFI